MFVTEWLEVRDYDAKSPARRDETNSQRGSAGQTIQLKPGAPSGAAHLSDDRVRNIWKRRLVMFITESP